MGYLYAIIASLFQAFYVVPRKFSKASPDVYTYFAALGFLIFALIKYFIDGGANFIDTRLIASVGMGICWAVGTVFFMVGIEKIGLAKSRQWSRFSYPITILVAFTFLHEHHSMNMWIFSAVFMAIVVAAWLLTFNTGQGARALKSGIEYSLASAIFFGIMPSLLKVASGANANAQQVVISASAVITILLFMLIRRRSLTPLCKIFTPDHLWPIVGGFGYMITSLLAILAYRYMPAVIGSTIIQLVAVWSILIGVFIFGEISWRRHRHRIILGTALVIAAILLTLWV